MELIQTLTQILSVLQSLIPILLVVAFAAAVTFRLVVVGLQQRAIRIHMQRASVSRSRALAVRARRW